MIRLQSSNVDQVAGQTEEVAAPEPELTELKCYGYEQEVLINNNKVKFDGYCRSEHGGETAQDGGG